MSDTKPILVVVQCADCERVASIEFGDGWLSTYWDGITLDGHVKVPEGWWAVPGSEDGDNRMRCPEHSAAYGQRFPVERRPR